MNNAKTNEIKLMAERMIIESRTDRHECATPETYCAGCQKMRDALKLLWLTGDRSVVRAGE